MPDLFRSFVQRLHRLAGGGAARWRSVLRGLTGSAAFSPTGVEIVAELPRERVLVLAPHPDDEIIGPGGALTLHRASGGRVTIVYLTDGGGPPGGSERRELVRARRREAEEVGHLLSLEQIFWSHPDTRLDPAAVSDDLARLLDSVAPASVYLPSWFEHHFDHYAANALLDRALATSTADPWICGFEVWDNLAAVNRVVDISHQLERKLEAMRLYETPLRHTDFAELIRHRAALHYLLHVDSRRTDPAGSAEAFLRLPAADFRRRFRSWDEQLRRSQSPLTAHLDRL